MCHSEFGANLPANICLYSMLNFQPGSLFSEMWPITTKWVESRKFKNMSYAYHWKEQNLSFNLVPKLFISYNIWQSYCRKSVYDFYEFTTSI